MSGKDGRGIDPDDVALVQSLVGRTITAAKWDDPAAGDEFEWTEHEVAELTLDDGRVIRFGGWGYDAWGATVDDVTDYRS